MPTPSVYARVAAERDALKVALRDGQPMIITVQHEHADGWHSFTCPEVPGFYLLTEDGDLESAYEQVPDAIGEIIESDEGFPVDVLLQHSYAAYVERLPEGMRSKIRHYAVKKAAA